MGFGFDFIKYKRSACLCHVQQTNHRVSFVFRLTTDLQKMPLGKLSFCISYFSETKSNPAQKFQSNVSQVKRSPQQGSKLTLANSQNASDFDKLRVRKISTSKRL